MKQFLDKYPYTATSIAFLVVILIGIAWFGWGQFALAYFALLYCIVIIGIRLDEITRQVRNLNSARTAPPGVSGNRRLQTPDVIEIHRLNHQLGEIKVLLEKIQRSLERASEKSDPQI